MRFERTRPLQILFAAALSLSGQDAPAVPGAPLLAADRAFAAATAEHGLDAWLAWLAPDVLVRGTDGAPLATADEVRAHYETGRFPPPGLTWEPDAARLASSGELGYTSGTWEVRVPGSDPAAAPRASGRYLTVWTRGPDGTWRVLADEGGEPGFRTLLAGADGPPLDWSSTGDWKKAAASGELLFTSGTWSARTALGERDGTYLSVWQRTADGWRVASEIGEEL